LVLLGVRDGAELRRQGGGVDGEVRGVGGGGRHKEVVDEGVAGLVRLVLVAVLGAEELLGQCDWVVAERSQGRRGADRAGVSPEALQLLDQDGVGLLGVDEKGLELLVALLESLNLKTLTLPRGLSGAAVTENTLNAALFLLVLGLGSLPGRQVGLGLREDLAPGLALLGSLLLL
jgi:hypothetical protein